MKFYKRTVRDVPLGGKTVLLRVDYNVPLDKDGEISDDFRIRASLETIKYLLNQHCKVVVISHLGRPEGVEQKLSLEPAAQRLAELLEQPVRFVGETVGDRVRMAIKRAPSASVVVLENLRFDPREKTNDEGFARELAESSGAHYFVQDGFGTVHRAHMSYVAITHYLPGVAGFLLEREVNTLSGVIEAPEHPLVAVMGGAKVSDKIALVKRFVDIADKIIIGGAMANTFLDYRGHNMGESSVEAGQKVTLDDIYAAAASKVGRESVDDFIILPSDVAVAHRLDASEPRRVVAVKDVAEGMMVLDIGDASIETMREAVRGAKTVIWNGTLGVADLPGFSHGSAELAKELAGSRETISIIGGGDTANFVRHWDPDEGRSFTHVSTGGGASLELMAGEKLPGVESLLDA